MNLSVLAPDMDLYQQAEEEGKTELEVVEEREAELRRLLDYHYLREHGRYNHREVAHSKYNRTLKRSGGEEERREVFMCEHPSSYMFVSDQLAKLHPTLFESGVVGCLDKKWHEKEYHKEEYDHWKWPGYDPEIADKQPFIKRGTLFPCRSSWGGTSILHRTPLFLRIFL